MTKAATTVLLTFLAVTCLANEDWVERRDIYNLTGNLSFGTKWDAEKGAHFKISHGGADKAITFNINPKKINIRLTPKSAYSSDILDKCQLNTASLPTNNLERAEIVLKFRRRIWTLYVENRPVAILPVPFVPPLVLSQPQEELPVTSLRDVYFQRIAGIDKFEDNFMVPENAPNQLERWEVDSGTWQIHTAKDNNTITTKRRRKQGPKADYSPNFYSLEGAGDNAIITTGHNFYDSYSMEASVQVAPGEMGIVFFFKKDKGYHAFTIDMDKNSQNVILKLWRVQPGKKNQREILAAAETTLTKHQWIKLRAKTFLNRIQCFMDNVKIIDISTELPAGGRFGLFVDHASGIRFDDVLAIQNRDIDFKGVTHLRRHTLVEHGKFFPKRNLLNLFSDLKLKNHLDVPKSKKTQWLMLGAPEHEGHLFSADFKPSTKTWSIGLIAGYTGPTDSYVRFTCERTEDDEIFQLVNITTNGTTPIESVKIPLSERTKKCKTITLMCDATNEKELRMYRNGELVLIHLPSFSMSGASGLYIGAKSPIIISNLAYNFQRDNLYRNQFEKNRMYQKDPFMRHWSSPEGQWIEMPDKTTWHKSDFFGRFLLRMPHIGGSEIHLGVQEGSSNGTIVIRSVNNAITIEPGPEIANSDNPEEFFLNPSETFPIKANTSANWFTIQYEDHCLWITANKQPPLKCYLREPLKGTRIRISGFSTEQLSESYVERFNVKDHLFTHSLSEWTINGGEWAIVNRFKCQPRWSHMNGESKNNLAAIWSKYNIQGDFCAEMYAGMRHGWYERAGDLNITVMNQTTTPGEGYTVTCTGWDENHSQLFTRLFRNGKQLSVSDKFLIPRSRKSFAFNAVDIRDGWNPLIRKGRPLHGSWFYIKLRRIGKKLEYYFDNELVFSVKDENPIESGSFGIWTFMNSMVVARVKVAAQHIEPKTFDFTTLKIDKNIKLTQRPEPTPPDVSGILVNSQSLEKSSQKDWSSTDSTGQSRLTWHSESGIGSYFASCSILGGGSAFTQCNIPPVKAHKLAGWRFYFKQNKDARLNFHYSIGTKDLYGKYKAEHRFFHHISGTDFSKGIFKLAGHTEIPPITSTNTNWYTKGNWSLVNAWIPSAATSSDITSDIWIKIEGFGNIQPSNIKQGLDGNKPGASYAIRDFSEIRYETPKLSIKENITACPAFSIHDQHTNKKPTEFTNINDAQEWIKNISRSGLITLAMENKGGDNKTKNELSWIRVPEEITPSCTWGKKYPYSIILTCNDKYPDQRLDEAIMTIASIPVPLKPDGLNQMIGLLPRNKDIFKANTMTVPISVDIDNKTHSFSLNMKDCPHNQPPVLMSLGNPNSSFENFEHRNPGKLLTLIPGRTDLQTLDSTQGTFLRIFNTKKGQRLKNSLHPHIQISRQPLLQFKYRGDPMSRVTLLANKGLGIDFSEQQKTTVNLRGSKKAIMDGKWHTWYGILSDIITNQPYVKNIFALNQLHMRSVEEIDQTGLFSELHIDDITFGPAISKAEHLIFTPEYFEFLGVESVLHSIHQGPIPFDELKETEISNLEWETTPASKKIKPNITELTSGISRLFIKAQGKNGKESSVTDIPFYMTLTPFKVSYDFKDSNHPEHNGSVLSLSAETGGIVLDINNIQLLWNGESVKIQPLGAHYVHGIDKDILTLNWPYIFRDQLRNSADQETVDITIANIRNGAGTIFPDISVPITIDYAKDKIAPTLTATTYPSNIMSYTGWENTACEQTYFKTPIHNDIKLVRKQGEIPYLRVSPAKTYAKVTHSFSSKWSVKEYPYLAFRLKFPENQQRKDSKLSLTLDIERNHSYRIPLTHKSFKTRHFNWTEIPEHIENQPGVWHSVRIDVREFLANQLSQNNINNLEVQSTTFVLSKEGASFDLQSMFIFKEGTAQDKVVINAFDASGIANTQLLCHVETEDTAIPPVVSDSRNNRNGWISLRALDKAGNYSCPVHVPLWPLAGKE